MELCRLPGVLELPAIFIAGGAGLRLAQALLFPGTLSRRDSLAVGGNEAVRLLVGVIPMLIVAGTIEGFFSSESVPRMLQFMACGAIHVTVASLERLKSPNIVQVRAECQRPVRRWRTLATALRPVFAAVRCLPHISIPKGLDYLRAPSPYLCYYMFNSIQTKPSILRIITSSRFYCIQIFAQCKRAAVCRLGQF